MDVLYYVVMILCLMSFTRKVRCCCCFYTTAYLWSNILRLVWLYVYVFRASTYQIHLGKFPALATSRDCILNIIVNLNKLVQLKTNKT